MKEGLAAYNFQFPGAAHYPGAPWYTGCSQSGTIEIDSTKPPQCPEILQAGLFKGGSGEVEDA